jgi:hypothetical protein
MDARHSAACEPAEHHGEDQSGDKRLKHDPSDAEDRLLVAELDIATGENHQQVAVLPDFAEVNCSPALCGLDYDCRMATFLG